MKCSAGKRVLLLKVDILLVEVRLSADGVDSPDDEEGPEVRHAVILLTSSHHDYRHILKLLVQHTIHSWRYTTHN